MTQRKHYVSVNTVLEYYPISKTQIYRYLSMPIFKPAIKKVGEKKIGIDLDTFDSILNQYFGSEIEQK